MSHDPAPRPNPKLTREVIKKRFDAINEQVRQLVWMAQELDWLGDAAQHPSKSEQRALAGTRDDIDFFLSRLLLDVSAYALRRAETTRSEDLLAFAYLNKRGDGPDALHLMQRFHELCPEEVNPSSNPDPESFPDSFAWDTYLRVSALADLAEQFPKHLRHGARQMHGWPMIVSHHIDGRNEFERVAERLEVGADYPLNVAPRKKRGTETPLLRYLEPKVWRLHVLREKLIETEEKRKGEDFIQRLRYFWWDFRDPRPSPEVLAILKRLTSLPPLTQKTAREWSREVIVPLIMLDDAGTRETCQVPALRNIWQHRAVKSRATFQSRLHSAVTDTLQRFGRPG